jgi:hypothetical protein
MLSLTKYEGRISYTSHLRAVSIPLAIGHYLIRFAPAINPETAR